MSSPMKKCPYCKEDIKAEAIKCRFCGEFLEVPKAGASANLEASVVEQVRGDTVEPTNSATVEPEDQITIIRLSKLCMLGAFLKMTVIHVVVGGFAIALYMYRGKVLPDWSIFPERLHVPVIFGIGGTLVTVASLWFLFRYLQFRAKVYKVSFDRIECRTGLFSRTVTNIETWRVQDVKLEQPLFYRLFGAGRVVIDSTDPDEPHLEIGPIGDAEENFQSIRRFAREADKRRGVVHFDQ